MKYFVIFLILIGFTTIIPNVFASENLFYGTSSLEKFPSAIVPDNSQIIEIKFQYQDGPYSLSDFGLIFDVHPTEAAPYVHIEFEPVDGIVRNSIVRIHGTITVDPDIPSEKIFLNIAYVGTYSIEPPVNFKSGWNDSAIIDISENLSGGHLDKIVFSMLPPLKQIKNDVALIDVQCSEGKYAVYKYNRMRVACVSEETQNELWGRGWATMRLAMPGDNISHALCNNYGGKWHPEYNGCRGISDLQCSLIGGKFDVLKICENGICPDKSYEICVTESENGSLKISESQYTQSSDTGLQVHVTGQQQARRGTTHDITVDVTRNGSPVSDSLVRITIEDYGKDIIREFEGKTDDSGRFVFSWEIPKSFDDIETLLAYVDVTDDISAKTVLFKFQVYCIPGESGCKVEGN